MLLKKSFPLLLEFYQDNRTNQLGGKTHKMLKEIFQISSFEHLKGYYDK